MPCQLDLFIVIEIMIIGGRVNHAQWGFYINVELYTCMFKV